MTHDAENMADCLNKAKNRREQGDENVWEQGNMTHDAGNMADCHKENIVHIIFLVILLVK